MKKIAGAGAFMKLFSFRLVLESDESPLRSQRNLLLRLKAWWRLQMGFHRIVDKLQASEFPPDGNCQWPLDTISVFLFQFPV